AHNGVDHVSEWSRLPPPPRPLAAWPAPDPSGSRVSRPGRVSGSPEGPSPPRDGPSSFHLPRSCLALPGPAQPPSRPDLRPPSAPSPRRSALLVPQGVFDLRGRAHTTRPPRHLRRYQASLPA